jgi:hypothetical protein
MKQVVSMCLQKDPTDRVCAAELLNHRFFKQARGKDYLVAFFLSGLSPRETPRSAGRGEPAQGLGGKAAMGLEVKWCSG